MLKNYFLWFCIFFVLHGRSQILTIPDANFKNALVNTLCVGNPENNNYNADADTNDDGEIELSEALAITKLKVSNQNIASLSGIENFQNLTSLICDSNQISTLTITNFFNLLTLSCSYNNMATLTITNCFNLNQLFCSGNLMTEIDLSSTTVSRCFIQSNPNLVMVNLKNGIFMDSSYAGRNTNPGEGIPPPPSRIEYNPNLVSICADDDEIEHIIGMNIIENNPNLVVSSYCTAVPGGNYNTVTGAVYVNCDTFPIAVPEIKLTYSNGSQTGHTFTGFNGNYLFFAPNGSITITPTFSVPGYFIF